MYVCVYSLFFIHSAIDGHLGCFHVLATLNSAAMNTGVHVSFWTFFYLFQIYPWERGCWVIWWLCCCLVTKSCPTFATPCTVACQASLSMGFPRQEYWSGLSFPSPRNLSDPETEPTSPALAGEFFSTEPCGKPYGRSTQGFKEPPYCSP